MTYRHGKNTTQSLHHLKKSVDKSGRMTFSFANPFKTKPGEKKVSGPLVVFLDVAAISEVPNKNFGGAKVPTITVYSNSLPALLDVR